MGRLRQNLLYSLSAGRTAAAVVEQADHALLLVVLFALAHVEPGVVVGVVVEVGCIVAVAGQDVAVGRKSVVDAAVVDLAE